MSFPAGGPDDEPAVSPAPLPPSPNPTPTPKLPQPLHAPKGMTPLTTPSQPHPFSALLTPYSSSPLYPPSPPSPPPPPLSTLRCLLLSSSLPPPSPPLHPLLPQTPYSPPPSTSASHREDNVSRSRAICWRRTELTKHEWERERKGVERWLRWCEGREIVLVSGGDSVRNWVLDGGVGGDIKDFDGPAMDGGGREKDPAAVAAKAKAGSALEQDEVSRFADQLKEKAGFPDLGTWVKGEENFTHLIPLHPPLHALLSANLRVFTTMHTMYTKYVGSFTNGHQLEAAKLVIDKAPSAFGFLVTSCKDAWVHAPENWGLVRKLVQTMENEERSERGEGGAGSSGAGEGPPTPSGSRGGTGGK